MVHLLTKRRFAPLFWVQFTCSMNDNIFKNALIVLITFQAFQSTSLAPGMLVNLAALLYILSFFLFSTIAGFIADKYEKSHLIQQLKLFEVLVLCIAGAAFSLHSLVFLLLILFLLGLQAAFFGPLKYSILPQHLNGTELIAANGLIEMGTFLAILIGSLLGSSLISLPHIGTTITLTLLIVSSSLGYWVSRKIPLAPAGNPTLILEAGKLFNIFYNLNIVRQNKIIWLTVLALSWFWLFGAFVLTQLPGYVATVLQGNSRVFSLFLAIFSIGIGVGSITCSKLCHSKISLKWVGLGATGMSVFSALLYLLSPTLTMISNLFGIAEFFAQTQSFAIALCLLGLSVSAGFYTVPLFVLLQQKSEVGSRARVIAANNILNSLFMIVAAVLGILLLKFHFSIPEMLLFIAIANAVVNGGLLMLKFRIKNLSFL